jgi:hypothetical protein
MQYIFVSDISYDKLINVLIKRFLRSLGKPAPGTRIQVSFFISRSTRRRRMGRVNVSIVLVSSLLLAWPTWAVADEGELLVSFSASGDGFRDLQIYVDIVRSFGTSYLALADQEDLDKLEIQGATLEILDRDPSTKSYYVVFFQSREELEEVDPRPHVLLVEGLMVLVRATPQEAADLTDLGVKVEKLHLDPIRLVGDPSAPSPGLLGSSLADSDQATSMRAPSVSSTPDPIIEAMVGAVSTSSLQTLANALVTNGGYGTRRADTAGGVAAAEYIHGVFESYGISGLDLGYEDIDEGSDVFSDNVVAEIPGSVNPQDIIILGAHYDSVCGSWISPCNGDPDSSAPGADDNATGTAAVLEAARVLSGYEFENTIRFVTFSAEEFVLVGSQYHADEAARTGENIVAMINIDMIGYVESGDDPDVDIIIQDDDGPEDDDTVAEADALRDRAIDAIDTYVNGFGRIREWAGSSWGATTDHRPFHRKGWPAIWFFEDKANYSPYIHTSMDTVGQSLNDWNFMTNCTKSIVATLATFAVPVEGPPPPPPAWEAAPAQTAAPVTGARGASYATLLNYSVMLLIPVAFLLVLRRKAGNRVARNLLK